MTIQDRLKRIQKYLGVEADGILGPATLTAAELKTGLLKPPPKTRASVPTGNNLSVSKASLDLIIRYEISSDAYYTKYLAKPTWPKGASGVTVGIGYDLGYNTKSQIAADYGGRVSENTLSHLQSAAGIKGEAASGVARALKNAGVVIPLDVAKAVFAESTLPRYGKLTRGAWPGVEKLPYDAQGALLSLVFNRGSSLKGSRRAEMANIKPLVAKGDLDGIADQIIQMKRLWRNKGLDGLLKRRDAEAKLVRNSRHSYSPDQIVHI